MTHLDVRERQPQASLMIDLPPLACPPSPTLSNPRPPLCPLWPPWPPLSTRSRALANSIVQMGRRVGPLSTEFYPYIHMTVCMTKSIANSSGM